MGNWIIEQCNNVINNRVEEMKYAGENYKSIGSNDVVHVGSTQALNIENSSRQSHPGNLNQLTVALQNAGLI